ncbi:carboxypeptidase T [Nonlabens dokdonensis DSW-6]|uniref:Carboxypeptidase T n=3 Tax=Nonlabens dokdonensis TaxID=328515 RepID=L7WAT2_NONDD|nr:carboxypeptidase T [Nonlabens dokdonensis DSW-6]
MSGYQLRNSSGGPASFAINGSDYIQRAASGGLPLGNPASGFSGNVIALEDHDGAGFFGPHSINTDQIDITGATGLSFTFRLAAPRGSDGNRYEPGDFLQVQYSIDGGAFQTLINTGGAPNTNFYYDVAGNGISGGGDDININQNSQQITKAIPGTGTSLVVRVRFDSQGPQEEMLFDDLLVTATSVVAVCNEPSIPTLSSSPSTVCVGSPATINISGNLNDATAWHIYTGSCSGSLVGTTTTGSFAIPAVNFSTTYFVRGEGGCVTPGSCGTITINPTAVDDASFSYSASSYCTSDSDPLPTITGTTGGTFSSTFGLSLNPSNGFIDLSASTPGNYSIAYTTSGSCPSSSSVNVTINGADSANFNYSTFSYCSNGADVSPTISGTTGGTFTSSPAGLSINSSSGLIDLSASSPAFYQITYTTGGVCSASSNQFISISGADDASFSYSASAYCQNESDPTPTITGSGGGTFTSGAGLSINTSSGTIDVSASTPGAYTITYTTSGSCPNSSTVAVTINGLDNASFSYSASSYCQDDTDPAPTVTGLGGGSFTSGAGLSINGSSGAIDVSASTPGAYTVTYTTSGSCPNSSTVAVTINGLDNASFSYSASAYCQNESDPTPTITGIGGGSFTSGAGLSINGSSGAIDVSASTPGAYTITYTTSGSCPNSSTVAVTINALDNASFSYSASAYCQDDADPTPTITGLGGGTFTSGTGLSINGSSGAIDVSASTPGAYTVTYTTVGTCPNTSTAIVTINALDDASFSYSATSYSASDADPTPTITGLGGGSFSSGLGLVVNSMTGTIDLSASTAGTYLVTYTTTGTCSSSASQSVTIASNDNLATPTALVYGAGCTGSIYNIQDSTLELGEDIPDCAFDTGAPFAPAQASSQWFTFVASSSGDALIKITDNGISGFGAQSASIGLTLSLYEAPSTLGDFSTLGAAIACSSTSITPPLEFLDGTFIDAKGLTQGNTYYVQVYSNDNSSIDYCIDVSEPVIYTYDNGWQAPNGDPELVNNPYKRVEILNGDAVQQPLTNSGQPVPPSVGSLYVAQNASVSYDNLVFNYKMQIDGTLNPLSGGIPTTATAAVSTTNQSLTAITGIGKANIGSFAYVNENGNTNSVNVDLEMDVYERFEMSDRPMNFLKTITFKSTDNRTAVFNSQNFAFPTSTVSSTASITGQVQVEQFIPENNSVRGRAYRFVSSPVSSMSTIFSQWQENGASPSGFGTHITGTSGTVGMVDAATGFDQTSSGANSMRTYSNDTSQSFNVVTSTNQAADSLKVAQAYLLYIRGDRNVDLTTNTSSSATVLRSTGILEHKPISKSYDVEQSDFIFTGNPYQNAVKVEDLIDASTNIEDDVVYYWDPTLGGLTGSGGAYVTYTGFDGGGAGIATPASANNGFIQPGQAVFVRANAGANGPTNDAVISYRPDQTDISGLVTGASNSVTSIPSTGPASISMSLYDTASFTSGNSLSDGLLIRFGSNYSNAIGAGDYVKIMNFDESVAVEQLANNYAVAGRSLPVHNEVIQLNHYNYGDTDYTYTIDLTGLTSVDAYIYDQYTSTSTPLVDGFNTFNFTVDASIIGSIAADRFQLRFENVTLGVEDTIAGAAFTMYPNPAATNAVISMQSSQLASKQAKLRVTDLSGKLISDRAIEFSAQGLYEWKDSDLKTGLYILEVSTEEGDKLVRKLVIE